MCIYGRGHEFLSLLCCKVKGKEGNEKAGYNDKNNDLFLKCAGQASRLVVHKVPSLLSQFQSLKISLDI